MPFGAPMMPTRTQSIDRASGNGASVRSTCKQVLEHDRAFMKELLRASSHAVAGRLIRQHFWELTQQFLIPLESFAARLMPLKRSINPFLNVSMVEKN